ncbi:MAG: arylsulfatase A-like enzyme [Cognaticolwellia sp.]|jgi:arylsulfatase A-like enzyme
MALFVPVFLSLLVGCDYSGVQDSADQDSAAPTSRPNILLVIADDMGLDASPCHSVGADPATMPTIETLCETGMVLDQAYAAPLCSPTRAMLMTGRYGFRTGVGTVIERTEPGLSSDEYSLFDALEEGGYSTALVGKWHISGQGDDDDHPATLGVPEYFGLISGSVASYYSWPAVHNGLSIQMDTYATTALADHAVSWLETQDGPWFLWLAFNAPHTPFHLPPAELHSQTDLTGSEEDISRNPQDYYRATLEALDSELGRVLDSLPEEQSANTVVVFMGDNGTPGKVAADVYDARGAKGSIYEGGTHVPMVVAGPDVQVGRSDALVSAPDVYATVLELAGLPIPEVDGVSFLPALQGQAGDRGAVYIEHFGEEDDESANVMGWAIRDGRYKLVAPDGAEMQLFDLAEDPYEAVDLLLGEPGDAELVKSLELQALVTALKE